MSEITSEDFAIVREYLIRLVDFMSGASHNCPVCSQEVQSAVLYGHVEPESYSLYVEPCGCRLGTWKQAPAWIQDVRIEMLNEN